MWVAIKSLKRGKYFKEKSKLKEIRVPIKIIRIMQLWFVVENAECFLSAKYPSKLPVMQS